MAESLSLIKSKMKKSLLLMFVLALSLTSSQAQKTTDQSPYNDLSSINEIIKKSDFYNDLTIVLGPTSSAVAANGTSELLEKFIEKNSFSTDPAMKLENSLLEKYQTNIKSYLEEITRFGETEGTLNFIDKERFPSGFANYKNQLTFCQAGIYSQYEYNTLKLNSTERAKKIVNEILLPSLYNFELLLDVSEIKFFAVIAGYTVRDFSSDSANDKKGETTAIVVSKANVKRYISAEITDEELIKLSIVYNINKATNNNIKMLAI